MSRIARGGLLLALCLVVVAGIVLTGCGGKKEKALVQPGLEFTGYVKGSTVDFDEATLDSMAAGGQASFLYSIAKTIYPSVWATHRDAVAAALFPPPYWRGDGVNTKYIYLSSADQTAVDGAIFAGSIPGKGLTAAEQAIVMNAVEGFFGLYADETAAAKPMGQNTAYYMLAASGMDAATWITEATAWVAALNTYAAATYSGKTYAQCTYAERAAAKAAVFNMGAGTINPEYSAWRIMTKDAFRNGTASATYPDVAEERALTLKGKSYSALDCAERPQVDAAVWLALTAGQQANVTERVAGIFTLSTEQVNGVTPDNQNIYFYTLAGLSDNLTATDNATQAAANWATAVNGTTPGTSENTSFYAQLKYGKAQWISMLSYKYFGTDNYSTLSTASQAVVDQSDLGTFALSVAQRSAAMSLDQNILYTTLSSSVSATAAAGWAVDAGAGVNRELAFYKWMAYEGFRNGIIAAQQYYPTQLAAKVPAGKTYTTLGTCEQRSVAAQMWASLGTGEQAYGNSVVAGIWSKAEAEMTDAFAIDQTTLSMALRGTMYTAGRIADGKAFYSETAAANFKADVEAGMLLRSAFYKWLAKESVKESAAAAVLIRESVGEFYIKVTNPNEYPIWIDIMRLYFKTTAGAGSQEVDAARQVLEGIWIPAREDDQDGEVLLKVLAPTKTYDLISWLAMAGIDTNTARAMATEVFNKIQAGTVVWTVKVEVQVSHEEDIQNYSYTLTET